MNAHVWQTPQEAHALSEGEVAVWRLPHGEPSPLDTTLGRYAGSWDGGMTVTRSGNGKPEIDGCRLHASLSHGGDATLVALSVGSPVGLDVEPFRHDIAGWALVPHVLTQAELRRLDDAPASQRANLVLRAWTRKEALLKASGHGLRVDPQLLELDAWGHVISVPSALGRVQDWSIGDIEVDAHVAAVAVHGPLARLSLYDAR